MSKNDILKEEQRIDELLVKVFDKLIGQIND